MSEPELEESVKQLRQMIATFQEIMADKSPLNADRLNGWSVDAISAGAQLIAEQGIKEMETVLGTQISPQAGCALVLAGLELGMKLGAPDDYR